jgi:transposase-like protein
MLTSRLPLLPPDARVVSPDLAVLLDDDSLVVYNASGIIYSCRRDDLEGLRLAAAMFTKLGLAKPTALARALDMHPGTVFRYRQLLVDGGVEALQVRKRGPKGPSKLTDQACERVQRRLAQGWSIRRAAKEVGVAEGTLRHAMKCSRLRPRAAAVAEPTPSSVEELARPAKRAEQDQACEAGVAVKRTNVRVLARFGKLPDAEL